MSNMIYSDIARGCLQTAEKLYKAFNPRATGAEIWRLDISGDTAGVSRYGNNISLNLPYIPLDARLTPDERDVFVGYTIHETGHVCFTDFDAWRDAIRHGVQDIVNGLEDVRMEGEICGSDVARNARALLQVLAETKLSGAVNRGYDPADADNLAYTLAIFGRSICLGYSLPSLPALDSATDAALSWIWPRLAACKSTKDVLVLALEISKKKPLQQQNEKKPQEGQTQDKTNQKGSKGQQEGKTDKEGQGESQGEGKGEGQGQGEGQGGRATENSGAKTGGGGAGVSHGGKMRGDAFGTQAIEADLSQIAERVRGRTKPQTLNEKGAEQELARAPLPHIRECKETPQSYHADATKLILETVFPSVAKLKADLTRLVKSPDRIGVSRGLSAGRFDRRAYTRAVSGQVNVFARRSYQEGVNAAVSIVLDASGSMQRVDKGQTRSRSTYAHAMALNIADALDKACVPFEISKTGHVNGYQVQILKSYNASWRKRRDTLGDLGTFVDTCNLVGAQSAVDRLLQVQDVTRRILFVLSDGKDMHSRHAWKRAQEIWAKKGVETIGIGFMEDVSGAFPDFVNVYDAETLAREGLGVLARRLRIPTAA